VKLSHDIGDPSAMLSALRIKPMPDGTIEGDDAAAIRMIEALDLNSPRLVEWRIVWMRIVELASRSDRELLKQLIGFPSDLPQLRGLRPPGGNARPAGIAESWAALAERGELPDHY
jgi:hypothetical protein